MKSALQALDACNSEDLWASLESAFMSGDASFVANYFDYFVASDLPRLITTFAVLGVLPTADDRCVQFALTHLPMEKLDTLQTQQLIETVHRRIQAMEAPDSTMATLNVVQREHPALIEALLSRALLAGDDSSIPEQLMAMNESHFGTKVRDWGFVLAAALAGGGPAVGAVFRFAPAPERLPALVQWAQASASGSHERSAVSLAQCMKCMEAPELRELAQKLGNWPLSLTEQVLSTPPDKNTTQAPRRTANIDRLFMNALLLSLPAEAIQPLRIPDILLQEHYRTFKSVYDQLKPPPATWRRMISRVNILDTPAF